MPYTDAFHSSAVHVHFVEGDEAFYDELVRQGAIKDAQKEIHPNLETMQRRVLETTHWKTVVIRSGRMPFGLPKALGRIMVLTYYIREDEDDNHTEEYLDECYAEPHIPQNFDVSIEILKVSRELFEADPYADLPLKTANLIRELESNAYRYGYENKDKLKELLLAAPEKAEWAITIATEFVKSLGIPGKTVELQSRYNHVFFTLFELVQQYDSLFSKEGAVISDFWNTVIKLA